MAPCALVGLAEIGVLVSWGFGWVYWVSTNWVLWLLWVGWVGFFGIASVGAGFLGSWVLLYRFLGSFFLVGFVFWGLGLVYWVQWVWAGFFLLVF